MSEECLPAVVVATVPGRIVARTDDGREICFSKVAVLSKRIAIGSPVLLSKVRLRGEVAWASVVELDAARAALQEELVARQDALMTPEPTTFDGVIEEVDGDAVRARLADGRDVWFRSAKCADFRGHLGLRVRVTVQPERVKAVEVAPEDVEKNRALCKELEPKPVQPIRLEPRR